MEKKLRRNSGLIEFIVLMAICIPCFIWAIYEIYTEEQKITAFFVEMCIFFIIMVFGVIWVLVKKTGKRFMKEINIYLQRHSEVTMEDLEEEFQEAERCGKKVWIGKNHIFGLDSNGSWPFVFPMKDADCIEIVQRKKRIKVKPFIAYIDIYSVEYHVDGEEYRIDVGKNWGYAKIIKDALETANFSEKYVSAMEQMHQAWLRKQENNIWNWRD